MYFGAFLFLVAISVGVSLAAFYWGLRSGQFSDQDRARYLALGGDLLSEPIVAAPLRKQRMQSAWLLLIVIVCLAVCAAAVTLSLQYR